MTGEIMDQAALTWGGCKQRGNCCEKPIMLISHDQIQCLNATRAHILEQTTPLELLPDETNILQALL
jgi:hypothetical protein